MPASLSSSYTPTSRAEGELYRGRNSEGYIPGGPPMPEVHNNNRRTREVSPAPPPLSGLRTRSGTGYAGKANRVARKVIQLAITTPFRSPLLSPGVKSEPPSPDTPLSPDLDGNNQGDKDPSSPDRARSPLSTKSSQRLKQPALISTARQKVSRFLSYTSIDDRIRSSTPKSALRCSGANCNDDLSLLLNTEIFGDDEKTPTRFYHQSHLPGRQGNGSVSFGYDDSNNVTSMTYKRNGSSSSQANRKKQSCGARAVGCVRRNPCLAVTAALAAVAGYAYLSAETSQRVCYEDPKDHATAWCATLPPGAEEATAVFKQYVIIPDWVRNTRAIQTSYNVASVGKRFLLDPVTNYFVKPVFEPLVGRVLDFFGR